MKFFDIFDFQNKSHIKAGDGQKEGLYPFFTSSPILSKYLNTFQLEENSLIFGTGGGASVHYCRQPFSVSTDCLVAQIKDEQAGNFDIKYIYYYLSGNIRLLEDGFRGAGLKHISKGYINDIEIPVVGLAQQKRIVKILDEACRLRQKREESIRMLDEYLISKYMNMFRDDKDFELVKLEILSTENKGSMRTGPFGSDLKHSEFVDSGVAVIGIDNAVNNRFEWGKRRFITEEKYDKLKRYTVHPGDVIITIMGTTGRSAVIPDDIPMAINTKHLVAITFDKAKANPYFISYAFQVDQRIKQQIAKQSKGAIMDGLNLGIIKNLEVPKWPINMQNDFETIYSETQNLKSKMSVQLLVLENGFNALLQKAFRI